MADLPGGVTPPPICGHCEEWHWTMMTMVGEATLKSPYQRHLEAGGKRAKAGTPCSRCGRPLEGRGKGSQPRTVRDVIDAAARRWD